MTDSSLKNHIKFQWIDLVKCVVILIKDSILIILTFLLLLAIEYASTLLGLAQKDIVITVIESHFYFVFIFILLAFIADLLRYFIKRSKS